MKTAIVLASESPRRRELMEVLGLPFTVMPAAIDETPKKGEEPEKYAARVARDKALAVASRVSDSQIIAADTVVTIKGLILGKPVDENDAVRMLRLLSGRQHTVYTAVCLIDQPGAEMLEGIDKTEVLFKSLTDVEILEYIRRENVMDKAGAYAIQGFASVYIPKIEGNYTNVLGLPLPLVRDLLHRVRIYL